jgi:hypothetical protein
MWSEALPYIYLAAVSGGCVGLFTHTLGHLGEIIINDNPLVLVIELIIAITGLLIGIAKFYQVVLKYNRRGQNEELSKKGRSKEG